MIAQWLKSNWFWIALLLAFIFGLIPFEYHRYRNRGRLKVEAFPKSRILGSNGPHIPVRVRNKGNRAVNDVSVSTGVRGVVDIPDTEFHDRETMAPIRRKVGRKPQTYSAIERQRSRERHPGRHN